MELRKEKFVIPAGNRSFDQLKDETVIMVTGMHWKAYLLPIFVLALTTTFAFTKVVAGPQEPIFNAWIRLFFRQDVRFTRIYGSYNFPYGNVNRIFINDSLINIHVGQIRNHLQNHKPSRDKIMGHFQIRIQPASAFTLQSRGYPSRCNSTDMRNKRRDRLVAGNDNPFPERRQL